MSRPLLRFRLLAMALGVFACTDRTSTSEAETGGSNAAAPSKLDLWSGVPPLEPHDDDTRVDLVPEPGPPRPKSVSEALESPFPPADAEAPPPNETASTGPLVVERFGPEGAVSVVDAVQITFSEAMVPLGTLDALDEHPLPFAIEPAFAGKARWLGTKTVAFVADGRIPFSTRYTVTVPAGTTSTHGQSLDKDVRFSFSTPTLVLEASTPSADEQDVGLTPEIDLTFDQAVRREAVLAALKLRGGGKTIALAVRPDPVPPKGATPPEPWQAARVLRLAPTAALAPDTAYTLALPRGVFGEGPEASEPISISFRTYPPLRVRSVGCDTPPCFADEGIVVTTTTRIEDPRLVEKVHVEPAPGDLSVSTRWDGIHIGGTFVGEASYRVKIDAGLTDAFGQTLAKPHTSTVKLGPLSPGLQPSDPSRHPAVIEPGEWAKLSLRATGIDEVEISARSYGPEDAAKLTRTPWTDDWAWPTSMFGAPTLVRSVNARASRRSPLPLEILTAELLTAPEHRFGWIHARSNAFRRYGADVRVGVLHPFEVTDLGLAAVLEHTGGTVMVTRFSDGKPVAGVELSLLAEDGTSLWNGTSSATGIATVTFARQPELVLARHGKESAFMLLQGADLRGNWGGQLGAPRHDEPRVFIYTDRTPYKPGETVHVAGIVRLEESGPKGGVALWKAGSKAKYAVTTPRGLDVAGGDVEIGPFGTWSVDVETKEEHGTGDYAFRLTVPGGEENFYHSIPFETFRTPEFEVEVEREESLRGPAGPGLRPLRYGDTLEAHVEARYLHGAPLVGAAASYRVSRSVTGFQPPGALNDGFSFGVEEVHPWAFSRFKFGGWTPPSTAITSGEGTTDARGRLALAVPLEPPKDENEGDGPEIGPASSGDTGKPDTGKPEASPPPRASTYTITANVTDENRQAIAGTASFVVHPALVYVGLRTDRSVLRAGERLQVEAVLVDLEGERVPRVPVAIELVRRETERTARQENGRWTYAYTTREEPAGGCEITSAAVPERCTIDVAEAGTHVVRATASDEDGKRTRTEITVYVYGSDAIVWDTSDQRVDLVPDRKTYEPGDTAAVLVRAPFDEARGFAVVERDGVAWQVPITVSGGATAIEVPITEAMLPSVTLSALLVRGRVEIAGAPPGQDLGLPAAATGQVRLAVATKAKEIAVALTPAHDEIAPGDTLSVGVLTTDAEGNGIPAALAVFVVDEGVLQLMGFETPDPLAFFHRERPGDVWLHALHKHVMPREPVPPEATDSAAAFGLGGLGLVGRGAGGGGGLPTNGHFLASPAAAAPLPESKRAAEALDVSRAAAQPVTLRTLFANTAFFDAEVETDAEGKATLSIPMPENLTTFRIMAVAVDPRAADRFGHGEASVRVRKPIMLRPSLPRFANYGDSFEASVMVDNQTADAQQVLVGTRGLNVTIPGEAERLVEIPAGQSREVRFDVATEAAGTLRMQFAALSNGGRDATEIAVPVRSPAVAEAFADYGTTEGSVARIVKPPTDVLPQYGGLELTFGSTALGGLEDAVEYLVDYEYECAEQIASRILPVFALGDVLAEFPIAGLRDAVERKRLGQSGIDELLAKQNGDGGFGYWGTGESWPYVSVWATFALLEGNASGFIVDDYALGRALQYIEAFVRDGRGSRFGEYYDGATRAFGLWLLARHGRGEGAFDGVWAHQRELPLYARALLMSAAHRYGRAKEREALLAELRGRVVDSARTVHFTERTSESASEGLRVLMHSSVQTDAIVLLALLDVAPREPYLPKVVAGIMAERDPKRGGRWATTHANAWALLAAARYYESFEAEVPDFVARVWLDDAYGGETRFEGRSMTKQRQRIPIAALQGKDERSLVIAREGKGVLYYRLGLDYAPADLKLEPREQGFVVHRTYEAVGEGGREPDPQAVVRSTDGSWVVKAGALVKVTIDVVARDRANYVVVDDPLPAGFEGQNPRFLTSVGASTERASTGAARGWFPWTPFSHTEMRDDRMLLFADHLPAGVYTYAYTARATTIGTFVLPPVHAEAMYEPEVFGRGASGIVRVVE